MTGVLYFFLPTHAPIAYGSDYFQVGGQCAHPNVKAHLVVALAGAAVGHRSGAHLSGRLHQALRDEGPSQSRGQGVLLLVNRSRSEGGADVVAVELLLGVGNQSLHRSDLQGLLLDGLQVHHSQVHGKGDYVGAVLLLEPPDCHGGVQSSAEGEDYLVRFVGFIGHARCLG